MIFSQSAGHDYISRLKISSLVIALSHATFKFQRKPTYCQKGDHLQNNFMLKSNRKNTFQNILIGLKVKLGVFRYFAQQYTFLLKSMYGPV